VRMNDDSLFFVPFALAKPVIIRYNSQSTEHRAQSTEHRAQSTEHRAQSTEHRSHNRSLIPFSKGVSFSSLRLSVPVRGAVFPGVEPFESYIDTGAKAVLPSS
jgi:hypothetical protein